MIYVVGSVSGSRKKCTISVPPLPAVVEVFYTGVAPTLSQDAVASQKWHLPASAHSASDRGHEQYHYDLKTLSV